MVLFFPEQHLSPDEHIAFGRLFGPLEAHPNLSYKSERPEFIELRAADGQGSVADEWHSDLTCVQHPSKIAILQAKIVPEVGGDTIWSNACKAYDELSAPLRELCDGLTAYHDAQPHLVPDKASAAARTSERRIRCMRKPITAAPGADTLGTMGIWGDSRATERPRREIKTPS